jgi:medium-chain acyl-[acyl-carrier-protein] hydrolase
MALPQADRWVVRFRPNPQARLRLFCLPYAGGSASVFRTWPALLPTEIELCAIQLPGRESRLGEPPLVRLASLVQTLAQAIFPYCTMPFAVFGHSLGALVGFELIRQLRRERYPAPLQLFVSGQTAPQLGDPDPPIHELPDPEFLQEIRRYNGTPEEVLRHAELMELLFPLLRADFALHETYTYVAEEPLDCPIAAFGGMQDPEVTRGQLSAWRAQTHQMFTLRMLPGDHFFLHSARTLLLQALSQDLVRLVAQPVYQLEP